MHLKLNYLLLCFLTITFLIPASQSLNCYQCDSAQDPDCQEEFDHADKENLSIKSKPCKVYGAGYCVKTTGVWGGVVGTTRFCSSRDMSAQCQFIRYPDHNRVYRACIHTCTGDGCNSSPRTMAAGSLFSLFAVALATVVVTSA